MSGMRSVDVRSLTEAAQSLGANWFQILLYVIFPNLRIAILSGALISFATVIGELILGDFLVRRHWDLTWYWLAGRERMNRLHSQS